MFDLVSFITTLPQVLQHQCSYSPSKTHLQNAHIRWRIILTFSVTDELYQSKFKAQVVKSF